MDIDRREPVQLGDSTQWIRIRAANARNPLLLLVQMGPRCAGRVKAPPDIGRADPAALTFARYPSSAAGDTFAPLPQFKP